MKPFDFRNATWSDLQATVQGRRLAVLAAWREHGPGTTRAVALKAGMDILAFRPRTTELYQLGLIDLAPTAHGTRNTEHEGIYRALTEAEAMAAFFDRQEEARREAQLELRLKS